MNDMGVIAKGRNAQYMREFRAAWKASGFEQVTVMLHTEDRDEVVAMIEVMRHEKIIEMLKQGDRDLASFVSTRNATKLPDMLYVDNLRETLGETTLSKERKRLAKDLLGAFATANKRRVAYGEMVKDSPFDDMLRALLVSYSNLTTWLAHYADAVIKSPKTGEEQDDDG
jgi:hypothetical protein